MKGFIINNDEVEEEEDEEGGESGEEDEEGKRKRDDDDDIDDRLEDDDFDLIEENLGIKVNRKVSNLCVCVRVCVCVWNNSVRLVSSLYCHLCCIGVRL